MKIFREKPAIAELREQINDDPIKKGVSFEQAYDVAMSIADNGDMPTLKMLKQVYYAYNEQNKEIAEKFFNILASSIIPEYGDRPSYIMISSAARKTIQECYMQMLANPRVIVKEKKTYQTTLDR